MLSIHDVLLSLAEHRPLYHSEADFQHALAWEIQRSLPDARIRLERPVSVAGKLVYVDVWVENQDQVVAIELKYKTKAATVDIEGESFALRNQNAQDFGRYDFLKDVQRLEQVVKLHPYTIGYAILLTNDRSYWQPATSHETVDAAFRLNEGNTLGGSLAWGPTVPAGATQGREAPIELRPSYHLSWLGYSQIPSSKNSLFRFLCVEVHASANVHPSPGDDTVLTMEDVPSPTASLHEIFAFALTFDGYNYHDSPDMCATIASRVSDEYNRTKSFPRDLVMLRTALFFEQRCLHHYGYPPGEEDVAYFRVLVDAIRRAIA